ncbi:MAG: molybdopterin cofactor-binding domain-containing protein, partial [Bauldia litoralis]
MAPYHTAVPASRRFEIGDPAPRPEDLRLLTGRGSYTDDVNLPGQAWGVAVRSTVAHANITRIYTKAALKMPGILAVFTGADLLEAGYAAFPCSLPLKNRDGSPLRVPDRPVLAHDRVRHVGEAVAFVVAETQSQARDAAEAIDLDLVPLDTVIGLETASAAGTVRIHKDIAANTALDWTFGDADAVDAAFAEADHVTRINLTNTRIAASPLEPRAAVAQFDPATTGFTLHVGCQGVFGLSNGLANLVGVDRDRMRVVSNAV